MRAQVIVSLITGMTVAIPAAGAAEEARAAPETFLVLGVSTPGHEHFVTIHCDPASGTHPHAEATCNALLAAGGDIDKIVGQPGTLCPDIYDPATATASGQYQGVQLIFRRTYANHCELDTETAPVFQF
ncbi:MAG: subtilase-type protease inhibitor [Pseudonocardia sp.]|nr:subtilase-type protease inhibitor [Pseudonocardia sp.]